uniref:Uncharacterized protein n=1 Tax=Anopheles dirus TaxID=7168 RepID=A0A182NX91_9DIPT
MTIQNGCFFMIHCLIEAKFDYTLSNTQKQWNIFHYAAASESKYNNRALKIYQYFIRLGYNDRFDVVDGDGNSVYDIAVVKSNFDIAKEMIESKYLSSADRALRLVSSQEILNNQNEFNIASEYFKYLSESDDSVWKEAVNILKTRRTFI